MDTLQQSRTFMVSNDRTHCSCGGAAAAVVVAAAAAVVKVYSLPR